MGLSRTTHGAFGPAAIAEADADVAERKPRRGESLGTTTKGVFLGEEDVIAPPTAEDLKWDNSERMGDVRRDQHAAERLQFAATLGARKGPELEIVTESGVGPDALVQAHGVPPSTS